MKKLILLSIFSILLFAKINGQIPVLNSAANNIDFNKIGKAVVVVKCYDYDKNFIGYGSGFVIDESGSVVTSYHVVKNVYFIKIKFFQQ